MLALFLYITTLVLVILSSEVKMLSLYLQPISNLLRASFVVGLRDSLMTPSLGLRSMITRKEALSKC
jgi:hypothetical protein